MNKELEKTMPSVELTENKPLEGTIMAKVSESPEEVFIDDRLTDEQKAVIKKVMDTLPPEDRKNVVYATEDGKLYANRLELLEDFYLTDTATKIEPYPGTGAYRRVESSKGYSWVNNKVYLPEKGNNLYINPDTQGENKNGDTIYIYTGGSSPYTEVDAGLQYSPAHNNWAPVLSVNKVRDEVSKVKRMKAGQEVELKFYCNADNQVTLAVTGIDQDGVKNQYTMVYAAKGWRKDGTGCVIKRVTSIAQRTENFNTGSYIKNVKWSNCQIGTASTNAQIWSSKNGYDTLSYPSSSIVVVTYVNQANETDNIILKK